MHERLRTHAESVAFFGGGAREKAVIFLNSIITVCLINGCLLINIYLSLM